jgi:hypothetical protein
MSSECLFSMTPFAGPRGAKSVVRAFCMATGRVPVHSFDFHLIAQLEYV